MTPIPQPSRRLSALVLAAALVAPMPAAAQEAGRLVVEGEGRVAAAPDTATLRLGVREQAPGAREALDGASEAAAGVLAALRDAGVAEADIRTSELGLAPLYDRNDGTRVRAFAATNVVEARIRDLDALGAAIDAASEAGANRIDGIAFALADPAPVMEEARRRAVADARAAAETLAGAAGATLGPVLRIDAGGGPPPFAPSDVVMRAEATAAPIAPGEVETVARISMTFALDEGGGGAAE